MKHHMVLYGPLQPQRSNDYRDATGDSVSLGNIGVEWLIPSAILIACALGLFHLFHVRLLYQMICLGVTLGWSFLMFSYLHDVQHIEGFWMERNRFLRGWFVSARSLHKIHHQAINDEGLMDRNFGIGFFFFDRLFGTLSRGETRFNHDGYRVAQKRFRSIISGNLHLPGATIRAGSSWPETRH
jgi:sterol desaturase/sphingolipid hydroxylase (fatty acid hydroxylase superfamily)